MLRIVAFIVVLLCLGCSLVHRSSSEGELSESEALQLAVSIANSKCNEEFSETPFDETSYTISFRDGRWVWGALDVYGIYGFSALVSFDARGADRQSTIFFSYDYPIPVTRDRQEE
jgi:hypothetical protein